LSAVPDLPIVYSIRIYCSALYRQQRNGAKVAAEWKPPARP
jgi:hypothetical protein